MASKHTPVSDLFADKLANIYEAIRQQELKRGEVIGNYVTVNIYSVGNIVRLDVKPKED
jgi:hypothetical protein